MATNNMGILYKLLKEFEWKTNEVYKDSLGYYTVGIGHKITGYEIPQIPKIVGHKITDKQLENLFIKDIDNAIKVANNIFPNYSVHPNDVKVFMVLMGFNLGYRLKSFKRANKALIEFNYGTARLEYLNSIWVTQVHSYRAIKTTNLLKFKHE